jgi:hypothetical protein
MERVLDHGHAALEDWELGHGNRTRKDRPERAEPDRLGSGRFGERGELIRRPVGSPGHPAKRANADAPAAELGGGPDSRLAGPAVRCAPGDVIVARPQGHGSALRNRKGERDLPLLAEFFGHGVDWHAASEGSHRARWHAGTGIGQASGETDMSLYFYASVYDGLRVYNRASH